MLTQVTKKMATMAYGDASNPGVIIVDVRDLDDNETNRVKVMNKVLAGRDLLQQGYSIAFRCLKGHNRSPHIAATVMAYQLNISWDEAIGRVTANNDEPNHWKEHPQLSSTCKDVLRFLRDTEGYN